MLAALTKSRPANFYANQVKLLLTIILAILFINSPNARNFTANILTTAADFVDTN